MSTPVEEARQVGESSNQNDENNKNSDAGGGEAAPSEQIEESEEENQVQVLHPPSQQGQAAQQQQNRYVQLTAEESQLIADQDPWQTLVEHPLTAQQRRLQLILYRYPLSQIGNQNVRHTLRRYAQIALLQLSQLFLGTRFTSREVRRYCRDHIPSAFDDLSIGTEITQIEELRAFVNYEHTNPVRVFILFCEFLARHYTWFESTLRHVSETEYTARIVWQAPYRAPEWHGLSQHFRISPGGRHAVIQGGCRVLVENHRVEEIDRFSIPSLPPPIQPTVSIRGDSDSDTESEGENQ